MTDSIFSPPHNLEAEQSVLGSLLIDDDSSERVQKVLSILKPESFYSRAHQVIFEEMRQMYRENKPVDGLTLYDALESKGLASQVGGFAYLSELTKVMPSAANSVAYAISVREAAMERYGIQRMTEATELFYARNGMTAAQKYEAIQAIFTHMAEHGRTGIRRGARPFMEVMEDWVTELEGRFDPRQRARGLSTGIASLDEMLQPKGLVRGSLLVIGARPKWVKRRCTVSWLSTVPSVKTSRLFFSVLKCLISRSLNVWLGNYLAVTPIFSTAVLIISLSFHTQTPGLCKWQKVETCS